jgi:hypothetical protein
MIWYSLIDSWGTKLRFSKGECHSPYSNSVSGFLVETLLKEQSGNAGNILAAVSRRDRILVNGLNGGS